MADNLVIVESPAKARTIEKYLGSGYKVMASMGHLRDLPKSKLGVDIEDDFRPDYIPVKGREDVIRELAKRAKSAPIVYLASDPDREGEAIAWHLREMLKLPDEKARRVTFNEITKKVVQEGIAHPRDIDMDLVDSQQARRILDRIVGYKLSPLLWRKVRRGLSAGRVQSVAVRMVLDREREIRAFVPEEYWHLDALLQRGGDGGSFLARYYGDGEKKRELKNESEVEAIVRDVEKADWSITAVRRGQKQRSPAPPFITSTLQQEASRRLGMTPRRTMSIAQQLYEGVDITGEGTVGLITYMRTDSLRLSPEALSAAADYIRSRYGEDYYPGSPRYFRAKDKERVQDAHEAIRPSNIRLDPDTVRKDLTPEQYRLYRLIWGRFTACQMSNAVYDNVTIDAAAAGHVFRAGFSELRFAGYTAVYEDKGEDEEALRKPLPNLCEGESVHPEKLTREQQFTQPPARYTEATLIRALEEKGIGRPSTYAPTISNITAKEYVAKDGKYLKPTPLGEAVTEEIMEQYFPDIVDLRFTANMEDKLDEIENAESSWKNLLREFYGGFEKELENAEAKLEGKHIKVPDEESDEICDVCGRRMVVKSGRFGRFLACPGFPECTFTKPLVVEMPGKCPKCGSRMLKRTSQKGATYYSCEKRREDGCDFWTWDVPVKDVCPECGKTMFKLSGKGLRKPFCVNEECPAFLPEDKRGYRSRRAKTETGTEKAEEAAAEKTEKKPAAKKTAAKAATAEKTTTKAAAAKKTTAKKAAASKTTAKKTSAAKKPAVKKAAGEDQE